jgi:hypothetical protein
VLVRTVAPDTGGMVSGAEFIDFRPLTASVLFSTGPINRGWRIGGGEFLRLYHAPPIAIVEGALEAGE